jgi:hypothetical protein
MAIPSQTIRSCSTPTRWRVPLSPILVLIQLLTAGCGLHSTVKGIPENEAPSVREGKKTVVLFRLAPLLDNTPVTTVAKIHSLEFPFHILHADIDQRKSPSLSPSFSPSAEAAAENWLYYLIPPGKYWVGFLDQPMRWVNPNSRSNHFFLEVPEGVPLLYAGTLSYKCLSRWTIAGRMAGLCGGLSIRDESEAAGTVARRDLGEYGPMETILLRPMTWKPVAGGPTILAPMGVALKGSLSVSTPEWKLRGIGRATGLGSETVVSLLSQPPSPGSSSSSFEERLYLGYALYLPLGTVAGLIGGENSAQKWSPCMNTIAAEVVTWSPRDALRTALVDALARHGVDDIIMVDNVSSGLEESVLPPVRTLFEVEIQEVVFRECGDRWTFCSEMKIHGRLRDLAKGRILYDGILIYSNDSRRFPFSKQWYGRPYEWLVNAHSVCRPIEKYCVPDGPKLFVEDLDEAIRFLSNRLVKEAGISPGRSESPRISSMPGYN